MFSYIYPNKISRKARSVTMGASKMLSRVNTLVNVGYGEELGGHQCSCDFVNEEMGILNRKEGKFLTRLYGNNEEFREEITNFVRDKKELDPDLILDKRCKTNTLNTLGNKYLTECITSKDNTKDLIEIMAK